MPFNGSGIFNRVYSWVADKAAGLNISSSRMDTDSNDIGAAFNNCITRDGQGQPTANLPMAAFRHTGCGNGVAATDYATMGQLQAQTGVAWSTDSGSVNAIAATYTPSVTALVDGMTLNVRAANTNTTTTPTFAPNGLTAHTITKTGGGTLNPGDIQANGEITLRYNLANTRWEYLNAPTVSSGQVISSASSSVSGYTLCNGQAISRTGANVGLFTVLNTLGLGVYGSGDGSTTFNVPDMRGYAPAGVDPSSSRLASFTTVGLAIGAATVTLTSAAIPAHTHSGVTAVENQSITFPISITSAIQSANHTHTNSFTSFVGSGSGGTGFASTTNSNAVATSIESATHTHGVTGNTGAQNNSHTHNFITDNGTGGGGSHANVQPTQSVFFLIKN
jgi:microcystin-dependent protein